MRAPHAANPKGQRLGLGAMAKSSGLTTVPQKQLSTASVLALYRFRWQIEPFFKRLKSLLHWRAYRRPRWPNA
jgi:hypothetical protein